MALYKHDAVSVNIGERLRELREARNFSMRALATRSGLSANALSMIERGRASPSVSTLYKLADALGVSITSFFSSNAEKKQVVFLQADELGARQTEPGECLQWNGACAVVVMRRVARPGEPHARGAPRAEPFLPAGNVPPIGRQV